MTQSEPGSSPATGLALPPAAWPAGWRDVIVAWRALWRGFGLQCAAAGLAILLLTAPALWNGFPLLQWDTGGYLARWFEGYLVPSRAGAYGLFITAGLPLNFWPNILIQSALTIWLLSCVCKACDLRPRLPRLLGLIALLSVTTTLPFLASVLLTDIFAGLSVLGLYLLVFGADVFTRPTRWALMALVAFSTATHSATFGLLAILCGLALGWRIVAPTRIARSGLRRALLAVMLGAALTLAGNYAVSRQVSWTPGGYGILFGRLLQDGLVKRYLDDTCHAPRLRLCPHRRTLPKTADEFLWSNSVFNDLGRFAGFGDEMRVIVIESLARYPALQLKAAISAALTQLVSVGTGEGVLNSVWHTYGIMQTYTPRVLPQMRAARQQHGELDFTLLNRIHIPVALIAMALLPLIVWAGRHNPAIRDIQTLAVTATAALLANALICGVLSNPHDRYGARLVWIAPLIVLIALMRWAAARDTAPAR